MPSSLSSFADNLTEGVQNNKCIDCISHLDYMSHKNG